MFCIFITRLSEYLRTNLLVTKLSEQGLDLFVVLIQFVQLNQLS